MSQASAYVAIGCQAAVAVTFARAAVTKMGATAFGDFREWLVLGVRVPPPVVRPVAVAVVAAEVATAMAVSLPAAAMVGFGTATLLSAVFTAVVAAMWRREVAVPCRCFGAGHSPPGATHLARNGALLLIAAVGGLLTWSGARPASFDDVGALSAIAGAAVAVLLVDIEEIVAVARPRRPARASGDARGARRTTSERATSP